MQLELRIGQLPGEVFRSLRQVKAAFSVNPDVVVAQFVLNHLQDADLPIHTFPVNVVVVFNDELEQARWFDLRAGEGDGHRDTDVDGAIDDDVKMTA